MNNPLGLQRQSRTHHRGRIRYGPSDGAGVRRGQARPSFLADFKEDAVKTAAQELAAAEVTGRSAVRCDVSDDVQVAAMVDPPSPSSAELMTLSTMPA